MSPRVTLPKAPEYAKRISVTALRNSCQTPPTEVPYVSGIILITSDACGAATRRILDDERVRKEHPLGVFLCNLDDVAVESRMDLHYALELSDLPVALLVGFKASLKVCRPVRTPEEFLSFLKDLDEIEFVE